MPTELLQTPTTLKTWRVRDAAVVGLILVGTLFVAVWFGPDSRKTLSSFHITPFQRSQFSLLVPILAELSAFAVSLFAIAKLRDLGEPLSSIGWNPNRRSSPKSILIGLGLAGVITLLFALFSIPPSRFGDGFSPISIGLFALTSVLIQPVVEESYFRGVLFVALANRLGEVSSVALSAVFFGLFHIGNYRLIWVYLIVGLTIGIVRMRTRSVVACVLCHAAYNAGILIFALVHIG